MYALGASSFGSQSTADLAAELGVPIPVSRVYLTTPPRTLPQGMSPYGPVVLSFKPDLTQQAAGQLDRVWERFYETLVPLAPRQVVLTIWHEPDSKIRSKGLSFAAWSAAFRRWLSHAHAWRAAHAPALFTTMLNLTNGPWRWAKENAGRYLEPGQPDLFGLDCYQDVPTDWLSPEDMIGPPFEWALTHGFRQLGVPEFGAVPDPRRAGWITETAEWLDGWDAVRFANAWIDKGSDFDVRVDDPMATRALRMAILRRQLG